MTLERCLRMVRLTWLRSVLLYRLKNVAQVMLEPSLTVTGMLSLTADLSRQWL